jgi:hypothetical protein
MTASKADPGRRFYGCHPIPAGQKRAHPLHSALLSRVVPIRKKSSARSAAPTKSPEISLRLDGGDVHPHNVDPSLVLALASSYVDALRSLAMTSDLDLDLRGLQIRDRCVEIAFGVNKLASARQATIEVIEALASTERPRGAVGAIDRLRDALGATPPAIHITVAAGSHWKRSLHVRETKDATPALELVALRAIPVRAGGATPVVRFHVEQENGFSLSTDIDMARALGGHLYREVEIEAEIARNELGAISGGRVLSFEPVESADPVEAWDRWFEQSSGDWDDDRVEALLGGRRD